ncbi:MAG: hypothetical protein Q8S03_13210 [Brevundimonas sp.]|uniref:hypothetical protein n=1 Tax=Brevundimonas sp. TaxID=1871086 RepID=UPI002736019D|nr:hypothetical protein [Brevundimonas sp.]MDP3405648.1 hypothetical protein [Brevundimonas sp.]
MLFSRLLPAVLVVMLMSCSTTAPGVYSGGGRGLEDPRSGQNVVDLHWCSEIYPDQMSRWQDEYIYSFHPDAGTFTLGSRTGQVRGLEEGRIVFSGFAFPWGRPPAPLQPGAPARPSQASCEFEFVRTRESS